MCEGGVCVRVFDTWCCLLDSGERGRRGRWDDTPVISLDLLKQTISQLIVLMIAEISKQQCTVYNLQYITYSI